MNEADHVRSVAALTRILFQQHFEETVARDERNRAIRLALVAGVSDKALAIAAMVNTSRISSIRRGAVVAVPPDIVHPLGVIAVCADYPCCGGSVRFHGDAMLDPGATAEKRCPSCGKSWLVTRTVIVSTDRGRVDELHWTDPTGGHS